MPAFFDDSHIRQILQAVNIIDFIANYVALKRRGKDMVGLCPFHQDHKPSMYVSESKQIFKCFACGTGGDVIKFLMLKEQLTFPEAVTFLAERLGIDLPERRSNIAPESSANRNELESHNRWAACFFRSQYEDENLGCEAREYITLRKISDETAKRFGLGYAPPGWDNLLQYAQNQSRSIADLTTLGLLVQKEQGGTYDRFRHRLMFPVLDAMGRVVAFGGRTLGDDPAKYMNSPESILFDKSRTLYGLNVAKDGIIKERRVVIVEGYTDCIMAHQYGLTNVVATLGTSLTPEHARVLSRYADTAILVFDSDQAGRNAADRAIEIFFTQQMVVKIVTLPDGDDPCDFLIKHGDQGNPMFDELVRHAPDALEYKWRITQEIMNDQDTVNGHKRAVDEYLSLLTGMAAVNNLNIIDRSYLVNHVAKVMHMQPDLVNAYMNRQQGRRTGLMDYQNERPVPENNYMVRDLRTRAQQEILEVLLNRPDLFPTVKDQVPDIDAFVDPEMKHIADRIWQCYSQDQNATLAQIIAGCSSTQLCSRMTELADRGEQRGNEEATIIGALASLRRLDFENSRKELRNMISQAKDKYGKDAEAALLLEIQAKHQSGKKGLYGLDK